MLDFKIRVTKFRPPMISLRSMILWLLYSHPEFGELCNDIFLTLSEHLDTYLSRLLEFRFPKEVASLHWRAFQKMRNPLGLY